MLFTVSVTSLTIGAFGRCRSLVTSNVHAHYAFVAELGAKVQSLVIEF